MILPAYEQIAQIAWQHRVCVEPYVSIINMVRGMYFDCSWNIRQQVADLAWLRVVEMERGGYNG